MGKKLRPADDGDSIKIAMALNHLKCARDLLKEVGAEKALKRARATLKSAEGALRHVRRCESSTL